MTASLARAQEEEVERRERRRNVALAVIVGAVVLAAIMLASLVLTRDSGDGGDWLAQYGFEESGASEAPARLPTSNAAGGASTGAPSTVTSVAGADDDPPALALAGDDFERIWSSAQEYESWLLRHPSVEFVDELYLPGTPTYEQVAGTIAELEQAGRRVDVVGYELVGITVDERPSPDVAVLRYADRWQERFVVDAATGAVLDHEISGGAAQLWRLELRRGADGRWRVTAIEHLASGDAG